MTASAEEIRAEVKKLLDEGRVKYFIGYRNGSAGPYAAPSFFTRAEEADELVWNPTCFHNLVRFLADERRESICGPENEEDNDKPVGIVVKGCDSRAAAVLLQEKFMERGDVYLLGVSCEDAGVIDNKKLVRKLGGAVPTKVEFGDDDNFTVTTDAGIIKIEKADILDDRCVECKARYPVVYDVVIGDKADRKPEKPYGSLDDIESMSPDERWAFWERELGKCIRCYACRSICPMCYCDECVVDTITFAVTADTAAEEKAQKIKWVERSSDTSENFFYHMVRAMHLAGRCIDCNECERACPVDIPLRLLNKKLEKEAKRLFDYDVGFDPDAPSLISSFRDEDPEDFIR
jgi:formate dehydrogenase subunit beta